MPQGFDVQAARDSGYTDDEILSHLTTTRKFDIAGAQTSGYSTDDIIKHLSASAPPADGGRTDAFSVTPTSPVGQTPYNASRPDRPTPYIDKMFQDIGPMSITADTPVYRAIRENGGNIQDLFGGIGGAAGFMLGSPAGPAGQAVGGAAGTGIGRMVGEGVRSTAINTYLGLHPEMRNPGIPFGDAVNMAAAEGVRGTRDAALAEMFGAGVGLMSRGPKPRMNYDPTSKSVRTINDVLKPANADASYDQSLRSTIDLVLEQSRLEGRGATPVKGVEDMVGLIKRGQGRLMQAKQQYLDPVADSIVLNQDGEIGKAIRATITSKMRTEAPAQAAQIEAIAAQYSQPFSLKQGEKYLQETNAELAPYYSKDVLARADAGTKQAVARNLAMSRTLKKQMYDSVEKFGGPGLAEIQRVWGNTNDVLEYGIPLSRQIKRFGTPSPVDIATEGTLDTMAGGIYSKAGALVRGGRAVTRLLAGDADTNLAKAFAELNDTQHLWNMPSPRPEPNPLQKLLMGTGETTPINAMDANVLGPGFRGARREGAMAPRQLIPGAPQDVPTDYRASGFEMGPIPDRSNVWASPAMPGVQTGQRTLPPPSAIYGEPVPRGEPGTVTGWMPGQPNWWPERRMLPATGETTPLQEFMSELSSQRGARREQAMQPLQLPAPAQPGVMRETVQTGPAGPRGIMDIGATTRNVQQLPDPTNMARAQKAAMLSDDDLAAAMNIAQRQFPDAIAVLDAEIAKRAAYKASSPTGLAGWFQK